MKQYLKIRLILLLLMGHIGFAQKSEPVFGTEVGNLGYNLLLNGLIGGIGGMINKPKTVKPWKAFSANFIKGMGGGAVCFIAKRTLPLIRNHFDYGVAYWANRMLFNVGNSIVFNASLSKNIFDTLYFEYYGINLAYRPVTKKIQAKLSLATSLMLAAQIGVFKGDIDWSRSLKYGAFFFDMGEEMYRISGGDKTGENAAGGFAMQNMFYIDPKLSPDERSKTIIHELLHTYQFLDYTTARHFFKPLYDSLVFKKGNFMDRVSKYVLFDLPYFFVPYSFLQKYDSSTVESEADFYGNMVSH